MRCASPNSTHPARNGASVTTSSRYAFEMRPLRHEKDVQSSFFGPLTVRRARPAYNRYDGALARGAADPGTDARTRTTRFTRMVPKAPE